MIVVHWTAIPDFEKSFNAFKNSRLPNSRQDITKASALNVSAQFLVNQNGKIYRLLPENTMARHVIGLNHCAIGIENVGGTANMPLTKKQLKSNIKLIKFLKEKFPKKTLRIFLRNTTGLQRSPAHLRKREKILRMHLF